MIENPFVRTLLVTAICKSKGRKSKSLSISLSLSLSLSGTHYWSMKWVFSDHWSWPMARQLCTGPLARVMVPGQWRGCGTWPMARLWYLANGVVTVPGQWRGRGASGHWRDGSWRIGQLLHTHRHCFGLIQPKTRLQTNNHHTGKILSTIALSSKSGSNAVQSDLFVSSNPRLHSQNV